MGRPVVLVVIKGLGLGGAERLIAEAVPFWDTSRFDYQVAYFLPWKNQLVGEIEAAGIPVTLLGSGRMGPAAGRTLRKLIAESAVDLVHVHSPAAAVLARTVSPAPVVYTEHNLAGSYRQPTRTLNRLTYHRNARLIAVSEAVAGSVLSFGGPDPMVIENAVHCQVSDAEAAAVRAELGLDDERPLVVHVGNIRPHKGHQNLLAATEHLLRAQPSVVVASVGGEKYPGDLERLRTEAKRAGMAESLRFLGRRDDARAFLAAADVVVNPSDVEGLPVVILEAMALARPVAATAVGGVPGVITDGETGLLVPPAEPEQLARAISRLLNEPDVARSLGRRAASLIERDYGMESMVRAIEKVYEEVLDGR